MSRITEAFQNGKAFIPFVTGGDPDLETSEKLIVAMEQAGADIIEIGIPFSDPIAEGAVVQAANERALTAGCTTDRLFDMIAHVRKTVKLPLVFLTYINPIVTYGKERFMKRCQEVGIDGVIVRDLPYEEKEELSEACQEYGIEMISVIASTSQERICKIAREAKGFLYCVSSPGETEVRQEIRTDMKAMAQLAKETSNLPVVIGGGISTPEQAAEMAAVSDGAIVGSAIVRLVAQYGRTSVEPMYDYVRKMKEVLKHI